MYETKSNKIKKKKWKNDVRFVQRPLLYLQVPDAVKCLLMTLVVINQRLTAEELKGF